MEDTKIEIIQPKTLEECFAYLDEKLQDKNLFKDILEKDILGMSHFSLGMWMRNNWYLWWHKKTAEKYADKNYPQDRPALVEYFNEVLNIHHADDMSSIIILSYHRHINGKELDLEAQIKKYHDFWLNRGIEINQSGNDEDEN